jgi:isopenicillin N synthase-like dioxygenase
MSMKVLVVDYRSPEAPVELARSLRETGFGVLREHPLPLDLLQEVAGEWSGFFANPAKRDYPFDPVVLDGYYGAEVAETAKGAEQRDLKEYFQIYPGGRYPREVSDAAQRYFEAARALAAELLAWIEAAVPDSLRARFPMSLAAMVEESPRTLLRILRYPPLSGDEPHGALRAAAHEDINLITVLPAAAEPGLEVQDAEGYWHAVPCDPGTVVINAGDMLQELTGGYFPSTTHRVVNPRGPAATRERISLPLFFHPRDEVQLSARHTALSYLEERLRDMGIRRSDET